MQKLLLFSLGTLILIGGIYAYRERAATADLVDTPQASTTPAATIVFDGEKYIPSSVTIRKGERVEWVNHSSVDFWPASDLHPTHSLYPDSGIFKCRTAEERQIFDACRPVSPGAAYSFTFGHAGEWKFHDHLWSSKRGVIIVR